MDFWITAGAVAALVGLTIALGFLRARPVATAGRSAEGGQEVRADLQVYRDQLREVDRDRARGVIAAADAERLKLEISRRILDADRKRDAAPEQAVTPVAVRMAGLAL